ncbi:hypothetical protein IE337_02265 [Weissella viridescens]|uniref:hypothetical protein n=1 Tax=Weissella viridescens TaxID=1629 RepID=UPI001747D3A4|nr:hypothetical protein [Weissella viridescens]QOD86458.1 hypothetical protein IE337_02265 [Weissella viridescens]WJI91590.1 hypothetical protein PWA48_02240 [Weissella viridescens]
MSRNETNANLIASTLTNSLGTTVIGHVNEPNLTIQLTLPTGVVETLNVDANGDFLYKVKDVTDGEQLLVQAVNATDVVAEVIVTVDMPAPVVTGVIATRDGKRTLEGRVNQPGTTVKMQLMGEDIEVVVDDNQEFEMPIPADVLSEQIQLSCYNEQTHKGSQSTVSLGVTSKTQPVPILTDEMIDEYRANKQDGATPANQQSENITAHNSVGTTPVDEFTPITRETGEIAFEDLDDTAETTNDPLIDQSFMEQVQHGSDQTVQSRSEQPAKRGVFGRLFGKLFGH